MRDVCVICQCTLPVLIYWCQYVKKNPILFCFVLFCFFYLIFFFFFPFCSLLLWCCLIFPLMPQVWMSLRLPRRDSSVTHPAAPGDKRWIRFIFIYSMSYFHISFFDVTIVYRFLTVWVSPSLPKRDSSVIHHAAPGAENWVIVLKSRCYIKIIWDWTVLKPELRSINRVHVDVFLLSECLETSFIKIWLASCTFQFLQ